MIGTNNDMDVAVGSVPASSSGGLKGGWEQLPATC